MHADMQLALSTHHQHRISQGLTECRRITTQKGKGSLGIWLAKGLTVLLAGIWVGNPS